MNLTEIKKELKELREIAIKDLTKEQEEKYFFLSDLYRQKIAQADEQELKELDKFEQTTQRKRRKQR